MKNISHKPIVLLAVYVALTIVVLGGDGQCLRHNQGGGLTATDTHTAQECPDKANNEGDSEEEFSLGEFDISLIDDYIKNYLTNILNL